MSFGLFWVLIWNWAFSAFSCHSAFISTSLSNSDYFKTSHNFEFVYDILNWESDFYWNREVSYKEETKIVAICLTPDGCSHSERGYAACGGSTVLVTGEEAKALRNWTENKKWFSLWMCMKNSIGVTSVEQKQNKKYVTASSTIKKNK